MAQKTIDYICAGCGCNLPFDDNSKVVLIYPKVKLTQDGYGHWNDRSTLDGKQPRLRVQHLGQKAHACCETCSGAVNDLLTQIGNAVKEENG